MPNTRGIVRVRRQLTRTKDGLSFTAPKRGKGRGVRITEGAVAALRDHRRRQNEDRLRLGTLWQDGGLVFTSTIGTSVDVGNLTYRSFRPLLERRPAAHKGPRPQAHGGDASARQGRPPQDSPGDARALHDNPDDGHLLPRPARHAGRRGGRHAGRPDLAALA